MVAAVIADLEGVEAFFDDIVVHSENFEEHCKTIKKLFQRLKEANLVLQPDKCEFLKKEINYLGHIINEEGIKPDPKKIEAVKKMPIPKNPKNIKQFLGLVGYYRRFIRNFAMIAKPLTNLLKKDQPFNWTEETQQAFENLRDKICEQPVLIAPNFEQEFILTTDASGYAVGGVLSQGEVGKDRPVAYVSRALTPAEINYCTFSKEALAIIFSVTQFRTYLYGRKFTLITDHRPLVWLNSHKDPSSRVTRWRLKLADYQFEVKYKKGSAREDVAWEGLQPGSCRRRD